jgi:uncharacterized protein (TIGR02302 family)
MRFSPAGATERVLHELDDHSHDGEPPIRVLLTRALSRARGSLLWERLWPALASLATALGLFLALSWAGLWMVLPPLARAIGVVVFALLTLVAAIPLLRLRVPSVHDGLRRLDRGSGEAHRPASAIADRIASDSDDPVTQALWRAHMERALMAARKLKAGWPQPRLGLRDPMALRALVLLLAAASFFAAGDDQVKRILVAFDWHGVVAPANFRIDAWVTPPNYTGRPPVMLPGLRPGETAQATGPVTVPAGSQLVVRGSGNVRFEVAHHGGLEDAPPDPHMALPAGNEEHRFIIKSDGSAAVRGVIGNELTWNFTAIPDRAPTIQLLKDPERQARGALRLDYKMEDDYGVTEAKATFVRKPDAQAQTPPRPLFEAPDFALTLPQARTRSGAAQTTHDLTEHPWAGAEVTMTLLARDEAGNEGRSEPHDFELPQRIFVKPVARALIEQRRILALDADAKPVVLTALDALTIAPERFTPDLGVYLGLRSIYYELARAKDDDALRGVVARMWDMAVQIEDGNVSQAEQALRQAQDALRAALDRNAGDDEIKKLTDDLRAALDKFMQALAEEMRKNPQALSRPLDKNTRMLSQQDLKSMIDRLENMARLGNKDAARQLLDQLQSMLENLQTARPGAGDEQDDDMMSALDELGDMIRKQQQLRDKTFKQGQDKHRQGQKQLGDLQQDQQALKNRLNKLLEQLRQHGLGNPDPGQSGKNQPGPGDKDGDQLGKAGEAMGDAEGELGEGDADSAVDSQGQALDAMRKGAQTLAQQMQQDGIGMGPGPGQPGRNGRQRAEQNTDPLGRPLRGREYGDDTTVKVPGEIDAQRARRVLEELRKRFGEGYRPQLELDYIERLLKDF